MGPETSGADFLIVLLLWGTLCVAVTAPGWAVVAVAAGRRRAVRGPGRSWPAGVAGALVGLLVSALVAPPAAAALSSGDAGTTAGTAAGVGAGWAACWLLALAAAPRRHRRSRRRSRRTPPQHAAATGAGWGR